MAVQSKVCFVKEVLIRLKLLPQNSDNNVGKFDTFHI